MGPPRSIVSLPDSSEPVHADIGCSGKQQNSLFRHVTFKRLRGRSRHIIAKQVMYLIVTVTPAFIIMVKRSIILRIIADASNHSCHFKKGIHVKVHLLIVFHFLKDLFQMLFGIKNRRFIHIVPEAVNSLVDQNPVLITKPLSCLVIKHIRKAAFPGPYPDNEIFSVFILAEVSVRFAFFIDIIAIFLFYTTINNGNEMNVLLPHFFDKLFKISEAVPVNREVLIPFHIINIEIDTVDGNVMLFIFRCHFTHFIRCIITPPALPITKCPAGCNIASSDQFTEFLHYIPVGSCLNQINFIVLLFHGNAKIINIGITNIEGHPARRIHKQAIGFMHSVTHHNEVVCSIQGIRVLAMIRIIAAIADVTPAPLIDATHIFSKPVHDFILFQGIMKTVFFFLKNTIAPCRGCDLLYHSICFNRFSKDIVPYHRSCP